MMKRTALVVGILLILGIGRSQAGEVPAAAKAILDKAEQIELFSLDLLSPEEDADNAKKAAFHGYPILGKVVVKGEKARKALVSALEKGARENDGVSADCFIPRHAIRATAGGKTVELVICFQCMNVHGYVGDKQDANFNIGQSPQAVFDKLLTDAGVKLAPKE